MENKESLLQVTVVLKSGNSFRFKCKNCQFKQKGITGEFWTYEITEADQIIQIQPSTIEAVSIIDLNDTDTTYDSKGRD